MTLSDHENETNEPNPENDDSHESDNSDDVDHVLGLRRAARRTSQQYRSGDALTYDILTEMRKHLANAFSMLSIVLPLFFAIVYFIRLSIIIPKRLLSRLNHLIVGWKICLIWSLSLGYISILNIQDRFIFLRPHVNLLFNF